MSLRFCMLEGVSGGQVAIAAAAVVAVGSEDGQTVVLHQGGQIAVKGGVAEVVLKLIAAAAPQSEAVGGLKKAA